jgi:hypothetical protein
MKKGDLTLEYVFLAFVGVITVVLVIGMISGWTFKTDRIMCKLSGSCDKTPTITDAQKINISTLQCPQTKDEIVKNAKLCLAKGKQGDVRGLCYVLFTPTCPGYSMNTNLKNELNPNPFQAEYIITYDGLDKKTSIFYDYQQLKVLIE